MQLNRKKKRPMVPTSSMSDIGFLLLIFIMLISLINQRHEVKIDYPEGKLLEKTQETDNLEIWIERNGNISVDGFVVTVEELEKKIAGTIAENPSTRVHILADRNTPYRYVNATVTILQRLQHRVVSFVVKEELR
ncbi:MAG: biopolymer transporter ExbD [Spirochaetales bacterium]|nr:biopolymer transporter ExbD [Spirochaetales bacterium]